MSTAITDLELLSQEEDKPNKTDLLGFSIEETARRLGDISPWTIRKMIKQGKIASVKIGTRRIIPGSEIARLLRGRSR